MVVFCCLIIGGCAPQSRVVKEAPKLLTQFRENGRWGYLDSTGVVALQPRYWGSGPFAEGLAAVREGGLYGYIDQQGRYALPPTYEFATEFRAGRAIVWPHDQPQLIDRTGRALTTAGTYPSLEWVLDEHDQPVELIVSSIFNGQGVLDLNGRLLIDTVYHDVRYLGANRFRLERAARLRTRNNPDSPADTTTTLEWGEASLGVADRHGHLVVPFGRYDDINGYADGRALASLPATRPDEDYSDSQLLDTLGHVLATIPGRHYFLGDKLYQDNVVVISRRPAGPFDINSDDFPAVLDRQGRQLFADSTLESLSPYHHGRAWAEAKAGGWYLVDKAGRRLHPKPLGQPIGPNFGNFVAPYFNHGVEAVRLDSTQVLLVDSTGRATGPARRLPFAYDDVLRVGNLLFFSKSTVQPGNHYDTRHGYWDLTTDLLVPPRFNRVADTYYRGLLPVVINGRDAYLNRAGHLLWQAPRPQAAGVVRNSDIMNRATYGVSSPDLRQFRRAGGWAVSGNMPRRLPGAPATAGQLRVRVATDVVDTLFRRQFAGHRLTISNATPDTILFDGQDSMIDLVLQARDLTGTWRDIEYMPRSFCGNSYHTLFLAPGQYWQVAVPAYAGSQPTQLRARLTPRRWPRSGKPRVWYSNEFAGRVNPAQFWRRPGYAFSNDIMNPYLD
ncbi:WG repeat-containing protein [Hymenobacter sp. M29]|uniref:WG repeat-containing protein n=1 Tax=Hymenobacter mellowenesis TaxID=3063995 RepID=A0ABT9A6Z8_9BACT|nr:WG repeat-containing protein [Hymenobacter sp. M29]MDO7845622.1 WG repeat-containing protein [Hymenobacter sp. M29]